MEVSVLCKDRSSSLMILRSVVRWIAYWTIGFEMTTNWYWRRLRQTLNKVVCVCKDILPEGRTSIYRYLQWGIFQSIEGVLAGLRGASEWDSIGDWNEHKVFSKFKGYILTEEKRLKTTLRRLSYDINQDNTLHTLTRGGRPERVRLKPWSCIAVYYTDMSYKYALPLLCLLLERVVWTMGVAKKSSVSPNEFILLGGSVQTVIASMHIRANQLQGQVL